MRLSVVVLLCTEVFKFPCSCKNWKSNFFFLRIWKNHNCSSWCFQQTRAILGPLAQHTPRPSRQWGWVVAGGFPRGLQVSAGKEVKPAAASAGSGVFGFPGHVAALPAPRK